MGVIISYDNKDANFIHDTVYQIAKQQLPAREYVQLSTGTEYRKKSTASASFFYSQLPFYIVKPLYTGLSYVLYKAGIPIIYTTTLPSLITYILIGFLLILWLQNYLTLFLSVAASLLIMVTAPLLNLIKLSSPDCISAFFLFGAVYFISERKSLALSFLFIVFAVFARLDNVIPGFYLLSFLFITKNFGKSISNAKYLFMLLILSASYMFIAQAANQYGWNSLYYPSFLQHLNLSYDFQPQFSLADYVALCKSQILTGVYSSHFILFVLLAVVLFIKPAYRKFVLLSLDQQIVIVMALTIVTRFILQPVVADRFYIPYYLCILVFVCKLCSNYSLSSSVIVAKKP